MSTYSRDNSGAPILERSWVLFLDVLGASAMAAGPGAADAARLLDGAIARARELTNDAADGEWFQSSWFSDNLALGTPIRPGWDQGEPELGTFLYVAGTVQLELALEGIFTRGGLTVGEYFMDENLSFGPALVDAVRLEKAAVHPRIVLGKPAVEMVATHLRFYKEPEESPHHADIWVDHHGDAFINYLDALDNYVDAHVAEAAHLVERHRDRVLEALDRSRSSPQVWSKYAWVASYHNAYCAEHGLDVLAIDPATATPSFAGVGRNE